ncbi:Alpha-L-fucosidase, partial [gut metagenome]
KAESLTVEEFNGLASYEPRDESPFRFGHFTTMGEITVNTGIDPDGITSYRRELSVSDALATVSFENDGIAYRRSFFVSYPDKVLVMRFTADKAAMQNLRFHYSPNPVIDGSTEVVSDDESVYSGVLKSNGMKLSLRVKALVNGGRLSTDRGDFVVENADDAVFILSAVTDYKMNFSPDFTSPATYTGEDPADSCRAVMAAASAKGYDSLLKTHLDDYHSLFDRVEFSICQEDDNAVPDLPTPKRLERFREGKEDHALEELYFQFGRYLLISSSRPGTLPANLQGIWNNNIDGPWHVDYHNNINLQMN